MTMAEATLAGELRALTPTTNEADAITALVDAYGTYAADAAAGAATVPSTNIEAGKAAMASVLVGMSIDNAGIAKIPASVIAFWAAAVVPPWPPAVSGVAPPNATLAGLLAKTFEDNRVESRSFEDATGAVAEDMHSQAIVGGLMNIPPPPTGTPTPIL